MENHIKHGLFGGVYPYFWRATHIFATKCSQGKPWKTPGGFNQFHSKSSKFEIFTASKGVFEIRNLV